jgi:hypothetical protein
VGVRFDESADASHSHLLDALLAKSSEESIIGLSSCRFTIGRNAHWETCSERVEGKTQAARARSGFIALVGGRTQPT